MRTNHSMDLDGALAHRNDGEFNGDEIARSGNMDPMLAPRPTGENGMFGLGAIDQKSLITIGLGVIAGWFIYKKMK